MEPVAQNFPAALLSKDIGNMLIQVVPVPPVVARAVGGQPNQRVLATINGQVLRRGLLLGKLVCQKLGLRVGDALHVSLAPAPYPDHMDLSDELAEGLDAWPSVSSPCRSWNSWPAWSKPSGPPRYFTPPVSVN